ncbi:MAG: single-stranded-DNA-specific exonuclease RecJ [bacterium]
MRKKWNIVKKPLNNKNSNISSVVKRILHKRGIEKSSDIKKFLNPDISNTYDPYQMKDMDLAVKRILKAVSNKEKIIIFGDYDVDGVTATTLLYYYFKEKFKIEVDYYLPDRIKEGYGINKGAVETINKDNYDLIITVDCGITALEEVKLANKYNIDVIITDHHQPGENLPESIANLDPHRRDDSYPFSSLAGVGVAFKLCQALEKKISNEFINSFLFRQLDLVTIGSVADIVPLQDENRILVSNGLKSISLTEKIGLKSLIEKLNLDIEDLTPGKIGYILAPPINAAGRLEKADLGIELFISDSRKDAVELADRLVEINRERQKEEQRTLEQALEMVKNIDLKKKKAIILSSKEWHPGVIGIVASRLVEKYYYPVILIALEQDIGKGSCRSIRNLNMYKALKNCSGYLENYGGHSQAAGLTIRNEKINKFKKVFYSYLETQLSQEDLIPQLNLDLIVNTKDITKKLYKEISQLRPFGVGNPEPKLLLNQVEVKKNYRVGKNNDHLKLILENDLEAIAFNFGDLNNIINKEKKINIAAGISINNWNNKEQVQLKVKDISICSSINFYPVNFYSTANDTIIYDNREVKERIEYLKQQLEYNKKLAVFLNNITKIEESASYFNREEVIYRPDNISKINKLNKVVLFFSRFDKSLIDKEINDLIFLSLPFSLREFKKIINMFSFTGDKKSLHFLFNKTDYFVNQRLIKNNLPTDKFIKKIYNNISYFPKDEIAVTKANKLIKDNKIKSNTKLLDKTMQILNELGIIKYNKTKIKLKDNYSKSKLDLSESVRYNKITQTINDFNEFCNLAFQNNLFELLEKL